MSEIPDVSLATLAGIAGQSGADAELDDVIYTPSSDVDVGQMHDISEGINSEPNK